MNNLNLLKISSAGWLVAMLVITAMLALTTNLQAEPKNVAKERATYYKLINERQVIRQRLAQLDRRAAQLMQQGQDPVVLHAEQVGLQDKLDLIELRLEIVAARLGFDVPLNDPVQPEAEVVEEDPIRAKANRAFERGRDRTMIRLREDAKRLLSSINFSRFLAEPVVDKNNY
ncbi:hypothetical protein KS4_00630 [Poriferisphaera corsica]|uniref:Uncharacterized protein n=1 Tax=Poriferisphaera corsica TaxID=2528020 RepID=A0A517YP82_9BACT|nr:hypothetical protein [Poriferisphaera corsica]QDU32035.1 hypothetical protein KS4_00630 [Poriferisphaera corsica]